MANTEEFSYLCRYIEEESKGITKHDHIPVPCIPEDFEVKPFDILVEELKEIGFTNIAESMIISSEPAGKERKIVAVKFGNSRDYDAGDLFDKNDTCVISYLASETDVKQADMENMITVPHGSSYYVGMDHNKAEEELKQLGFVSVVSAAEKRGKKKQKAEPDTAVSITVGGLSKFRKNTKFAKDADVVLEFVSSGNK